MDHAAFPMFHPRRALPCDFLGHEVELEVVAETSMPTSLREIDTMALLDKLE
jgi:hypothetical protein